MVNLQWQVEEYTHPHAFTPMATQAGDGRRVGIRVFKTVDGISGKNWIVRNTLEAVPLANTIHDFLIGQIVEQDYKWTASRRYIFQIVNITLTE